MGPLVKRGRRGRSRATRNLMALLLFVGPVGIAAGAIAVDLGLASQPEGYRSIADSPWMLPVFAGAAGVGASIAVRGEPIMLGLAFGLAFAVLGVVELALYGSYVLLPLGVVVSVLGALELRARRNAGNTRTE